MYILFIYLFSEEKEKREKYYIWVTKIQINDIVTIHLNQNKT